MQFEFATATRIIFGPGSVKSLGTAAGTFGASALVVLGSSSTRAAACLDDLRTAGIAVHEFHTLGEPTVETVLAGVEQAQQGACDLVVGLGGGSVLDTGKAIAALIRNPGDIYDYLEVVGRGQMLSKPAAPYIAVPTTAGSGSEVTRNAVLAVSDAKVKVSLRSAFLLPRLAIIDPELTYGLPPAQTATSGLDALAQVIEPFLSTGSNPMTDAFCREGINRIAQSLKRAFQNGGDTEAHREYVVGEPYGRTGAGRPRSWAPCTASPDRSAGCFRRLMAQSAPDYYPLSWTSTCVPCDRGMEQAMLDRFSEIARIMTADPQAPPEAGIMWLRALCESLGIQPLRAYGVGERDFPEIIEHARNASSMKGNPVQLTDGDLETIMQLAL